ncbi:helix-turn-helix domain-containing protein [Streptomyces syringium]|uniref:helix-turn-helix domain-containing protein n=1 Tax=Streptomyces syringium TaxID=76729 RepID=UPI0033F4DD8E
MGGRGVAGFDASALVALRAAAGFSQEELAGLARGHGAQVAGPHICLYERGRRTPRLGTLSALASALNVPLAELLQREVAGDLAWLRVRKGLSQRGLASALGIAQARWSRIERGQSTLDDHCVPLAAKLLGITEVRLRGALAAARRQPRG